MFVSSSIPEQYNKVAEISDNYIVLVRENKLNNNTSYSAYYQFFNPSTEVVYTDNYKITSGNSYTYNYHYTFNQYYNYIDYVDTNFTLDTFELTNVSNDLWDRHDYWSIGLIVGFLICLIVLIVNLATSLIHRGGIFHA